FKREFPDAVLKTEEIIDPVLFARLNTAEETGKISDLLCSDCQYLIKFSSFDGKTKRLTIPDSETRNEVFQFNMRQYLLHFKYEDEKADRPLKGPGSKWKKEAAVAIFSIDNKAKRKEVERLVIKYDAYTQSEIREKNKKLFVSAISKAQSE
ncbi:hypothetical protein KAR91_53680, partial [Candidatus Pacearchaeota archaeon]|nr:hypothetical protein [Candidatus Pacearchaeota archaeon]